MCKGRLSQGSRENVLGSPIFPPLHIFISINISLSHTMIIMDSLLPWTLTTCAELIHLNICVVNADYQDNLSQAAREWCARNHQLAVTSDLPPLSSVVTCQPVQPQKRKSGGRKKG